VRAWDLTPDNMINNTELSSLEETRGQFNGGKAEIKLGIDVHQDFDVVVMQVGRNESQTAAAFPKGSVPALGGQAQAKEWRASVRSV